MLKFIPLFSVWKLNPQQAMVIAACAKTHEVCVYIVDVSGITLQLTNERAMPDVRRHVPCRWQALTAVQKAQVRGRFQEYLESTYGKEEGWGVFGGAEYA